MTRRWKWIAASLLAVAVTVVVGFPAVFKHLPGPRHSAQSMISLKQISKAAVTYYAKHGRFPPSAPLTPTTPCCQLSHQRCDNTDWSHPTWKVLGFSIAPGYSQWHQYKFESRSEGRTAAFVAEAVQDFDCDGKTVAWRVSGRVGEDEAVVVTQPEIPDAEIAE